MSLLILLSPAKKLDFDRDCASLDYRQPAMWDKTTTLAKKLKKISAKKIGTLMKLSPNLAGLNYERYQEFEIEQTEKVSKPSMFVFNGEVYTGLEASSFNDKDLNFADKHLRILSGMYGLLKPLDFIQPYRLEMGTKLPVGKSKNLYEFWGNDISDGINDSATNEDTIINLASNEYFKAAKQKTLKSRIITPVFKDFKNGQLKTIMVYAKKSRGQMANFIVKNQIMDPEEIKAFNKEGYEYNENLSSENEWVFTR